ncbi:hypothetical protein BOTCAL_0169g00090 [Botryotinia calthae]|uniref:Uncharacterized protein n=1 Tax=Botryotinia calthae TaxID=38488 RepID=A0A4Y8D186_9HELO|nr:hypothetical protein BOTCAL_0169g00090 [Botryotinia calthae]
MPYFPLDVSELPLKILELSPHVVDAKKYMESRPDVYLARKPMAPLDGVVISFMAKRPTRRNPDNGEISWKMTIMQQKMSESLHTIENKYEGLSIKTSKIHYITDGHILRFEHHDVDASEIWATPNSPTTKATSKATLENLSQPDKIILFFAIVVMEFECEDLLNPGVAPVDETPEFCFVFDGKWTKPDDLIICPRLHSRGFYPPVVYYHSVYRKSIDITKKSLEICDVRMLPLWRRCICQAPATRIAIDLMESENVKMKMKHFCKV